MKYERKKKIGKKEIRKNKEEILVFLPKFINQLLLLLNSGLTLDESLVRIKKSYDNLENQSRNYFQIEFINVVKRSEKMGESPLRGFYEFGRYSNVKELARVGSILKENKSKGTDLRKFLEEQSVHLWKERKRIAQEKIRLGESKMSFPLGILLLTLIMVTSAPAIMQI